MISTLFRDVERRSWLLLLPVLLWAIFVYQSLLYGLLPQGLPGVQNFGPGDYKRALWCDLLCSSSPSQPRRVDTPTRKLPPWPLPTSTRPPRLESEVDTLTVEPDIPEAEEFKPAERIALMLSSHGELQSLIFKAFSCESHWFLGAFDRIVAFFLSAHATELICWSSNRNESAVCHFINSNPFTILFHIKN